MRNVSIVVFAVCLAAASSAAAQGAAPPDAPQNPAGAPQAAAKPGLRGQRAGTPPAVQNQTVQEVQEIWDTMVLNRAQTALQLDDAQYFAFFKQMRQLQAVRERHQLRREQLIKRLMQLTKPGTDTDDATLSAQTKALDDLESGMFQEEQKALAAVDQALTPFQRARFRVFEENMERQKLDMLARALSAVGNAPPTAPPPPAAGGSGRGGRGRL